MEKIEVKLHELMGRHRLKQSELAKASGVRYATLSPFYHGKSSRIDFDTLARLLRGLRILTGQPYGISDLLEYREVEDDLDDLLLTSSNLDLKQELNELEQDIPEAQRQAWLAAFDAGVA